MRTVRSLLGTWRVSGNSSSKVASGICWVGSGQRAKLVGFYEMVAARDCLPRLLLVLTTRLGSLQSQNREKRGMQTVPIAVIRLALLNALLNTPFWRDVVSLPTAAAWHGLFNNTSGRWSLVLWMAATMRKAYLHVLFFTNGSHDGVMRSCRCRLYIAIDCAKSRVWNLPI